MSNDPQMLRALGDLEGTVRNMSEQWKSQSKAQSAANGRRALYERFEGMSRQVGEMSGKLDGVTQDVAELKNDIQSEIMPTINAFREAAARKLGVLWAGKIFWSLVVAVAGSVGFAIHEMLLYFGGGKH